MLPKRKFRIISRRGLAAAALVAAALGVVPARAATPTVLYSFCAQSNASGICTDGVYPLAGRLADTAGNLFGTTQSGGAHGGVNAGGIVLGGTVFELTKSGTLTTLYSFCAQLNASGSCTDGNQPHAGLIADAKGNLFGTTEIGGANGLATAGVGAGTVFKLPPFAGTPGKANCQSQSVSALARQYGGLNNAAPALGFDSVQALQNAIMAFCEG
jgi:hypothetical protein